MTMGESTTPVSFYHPGIFVPWLLKEQLLGHPPVILTLEISKEKLDSMVAKAVGDSSPSLVQTPKAQP